MSKDKTQVWRAAHVEAVLFDYGLVLTGPPHPAAWEKMKALLGADEQRFHAAYWRPRHDYDRGTLTGSAYWRAVGEDLEHEMTAPQLTDLLAADVALWTQPNQPMIDWAAALQRAAVRTGILSNLGDDMEIGVMRTCAWMHSFTHRTFSHRLHTAKPDLAIYRHAAAGLEVPITSVLFVDDREDNIQAARAVGMQAIRYEDHKSFLREFQERSYQEQLPLPGPDPGS